MFESLSHLETLELIGGGVFQIIPESVGCAVRQQVIVGGFWDVEDTLRELNQSGAAIHIQVQGGKGRGDQYIHSVKWLYLDFDNVSTLPELPFDPHLVIRTKNGFHVYWNIQTSQNLDLWRRVQLELQDRLDSCPGVKATLSQVLRLAGTLHQKNEPHLVVVHSWAPNRRAYRLAEIAELLDVPLEAQESIDWDQYSSARSSYGPDALRILFPIVKRQLKRECGRIRGATKGCRYLSVRNASYCLGHYIHWGLDRDLAYRALMQRVREHRWIDRNLSVGRLQPVVVSGLQRGYANGEPAMNSDIRGKVSRAQQREAFIGELKTWLEENARPPKITIRELMAQVPIPDPLEAWDSAKQKSHHVGNMLVETGYVRRETRCKGETIYLLHDLTCK